MPMYEFECPVHGRFTELKPMGARTGMCPECGQDSKLVPSTFSFTFAGKPGGESKLRPGARRVG